MKWFRRGKGDTPHETLIIGIDREVKGDTFAWCAFARSPRTSAPVMSSGTYDGSDGFNGAVAMAIQNSGATVNTHIEVHYDPYSLTRDAEYASDMFFDCDIVLVEFPMTKARLDRGADDDATRAIRYLRDQKLVTRGH